MKKPARANKVVARHQALVNEKTVQRTFVSSPWAKLGVAVGVVAAMVVGVGIATAKNDDSPLNQVLSQVVPTNSTAILAALPNAAASAGSKHVTEPPRETIERCVAGHNESASCKENARLNDRWNKLSVQEKVKDPSTMTRLNAANTAHWKEHGVSLPGAEYYDQIAKDRAASLAGEPVWQVAVQQVRSLVQSVGDLRVLLGATGAAGTMSTEAMEVASLAPFLGLVPLVVAALFMHQLIPPTCVFIGTMSASI